MPHAGSRIADPTKDNVNAANWGIESAELLSKQSSSYEPNKAVHRTPEAPVTFVFVPGMAQN
jgi:hypothetical protein